jgi:hypothetical protein
VTVKPFVGQSQLSGAWCVIYRNERWEQERPTAWFNTWREAIAYALEDRHDG